MFNVYRSDSKHLVRPRAALYIGSKCRGIQALGNPELGRPAPRVRLHLTLVSCDDLPSRSEHCQHAGAAVRRKGTPAHLSVHKPHRRHPICTNSFSESRLTKQHFSGSIDRSAVVMQEVSVQRLVRGRGIPLARAMPQKLLHYSIFKRMKADHSHAAAWPQKSLEYLHASLQFSELLVDVHTQRLECLGRRIPLRLHMRPFWEAIPNHLGQLECPCERTSLGNGLADPP